MACFRAYSEEFRKNWCHGLREGGRDRRGNVMDVSETGRGSPPPSTTAILLTTFTSGLHLEY